VQSDTQVARRRSAILRWFYAAVALLFAAAFSIWATVRFSSSREHENALVIAGLAGLTFVFAAFICVGQAALIWIDARWGLEKFVWPRRRKRF
jgi:hypothetical protein